MITGPQMHLMLNHLPIVGFVLMTPVLALTWFRQRPDYKRAALLGVALVGALALPAFWTGEPAEEGIEHLAGVSENLIEAHEEAAEVALILAIVTAGVAGAGWIMTLRREGLLKVVVPVTTLLALATTATMAWVGHEGGKIRHPEIANGTASTSGGEARSADDDD